ncbi:hypothetical protein BGX29_012259, partial [Mortierella sp. GBA35]
MDGIREKCLERDFASEVDRMDEQGEDGDDGDTGDSEEEDKGDTDDYLEQDEDPLDDDRVLFRKALKICSFAANEIVGIIEQYSHDCIKYRGNNMAFQVFIAATV